MNSVHGLSAQLWPRSFSEAEWQTRKQFPMESSSFLEASQAWVPRYLYRWIGNPDFCSLIKALYLQPLDLVKTRMQVAKSSGGAKPSTVSLIISLCLGYLKYVFFYSLVLSPVSSRMKELQHYTMVNISSLKSDSTNNNTLKGLSAGLLRQATYTTTRSETKAALCNLGFYFCPHSRI